MKVREIYNFLDSAFPFSSAADYDNCGLLIGDQNAEISAAVIALDCTKNAIEFADKNGAGLLITHHPPIFDPLYKIDPGSAVEECVKRSIAVISAHTNLDVSPGGVNDRLCEVLGLTNISNLIIDGFSIRRGEFSLSLSADDAARLCRERLGGSVRYTGCDKKIKSVAVCSGSGGGMVKDIIKLGFDGFITGECKHSDLSAAAEKNFPVFSCGHFETENPIVSSLCERLSKAFPSGKFFAFTKSDIKFI